MYVIGKLIQTHSILRCARLCIWNISIWYIDIIIFDVMYYRSRSWRVYVGYSWLRCRSFGRRFVPGSNRYMGL